MIVCRVRVCTQHSIKRDPKWAPTHSRRSIGIRRNVISREGLPLSIETRPTIEQCRRNISSEHTNCTVTSRMNIQVRLNDIYYLLNELILPFVGLIIDCTEHRAVELFFFFPARPILI